MKKSNRINIRISRSAYEKLREVAHRRDTSILALIDKSAHRLKV